jgi:hypothetical protein
LQDPEALEKAESYVFALSEIKDPGMIPKHAKNMTTPEVIVEGSPPNSSIVGIIKDI